MKAMRIKDLLTVLRAHGAEYLRPGKGAHQIYVIYGVSVSIPNHKLVSPGVLRGIAKLTGIDFKAAA